MKLSKSLADLDAVADELLAKSQAAEGDEKPEEDITPEEVSDDSAAPEEPSEEDADKGEGESGEDLEKCDDGVKKSDDPESLDEGDEAAEEDESGEEEPSAEDVEKSIKDDFQANDTIAKSMEDSEFISAVVEVLAKSLSDVQYDAQAQHKSTVQANDIMAKSLLALTAANQTLRADNEKLTRRINKLEKSVTQGFEKVLDSLDEISSQPAHMRKSVQSIQMHDRDFGSSLNGTAIPTGFDSLSKSQVMSVLNSELYNGNQNVTPTDIISYESGAPLRQDLQSLVVSKINGK